LARKPFHQGGLSSKRQSASKIEKIKKRNHQNGVRKIAEKLVNPIFLKLPEIDRNVY